MRWGLQLAQPARLKVAAVGEATASAARKAGLQVAFVPATYVAESLVEGLLQSLQNQQASQRILLARAAIARDVIPDALRAAGAVVDVVDAYRNVLPEAAPEQLRQAIAEGTRRGHLHQFLQRNASGRSGACGWSCLALCRVPAVSIGPITSQTLRELGWPPAVEAVPSDIPGLIAAVVIFSAK